VEGVRLSCMYDADAVDVQPGERVRIKSHSEIRATLKENRHRRPWFDVEMVAYCGHEFTVTQRVEKIINEHRRNDADEESVHRAGWRNLSW
jgi:hypothetical protein